MIQLTDHSTYKVYCYNPRLGFDIFVGEFKSEAEAEFILNTAENRIKLGYPVTGLLKRARN